MSPRGMSEQETIKWLQDQRTINEEHSLSLVRDMAKMTIQNSALTAEIAEHKQSIADLCNTISYQTAQMGMLKVVNKQLRTKLSTVYDQVNREWVAIEESISQSMHSLKRGLRNAVVINEDD